MALHVSSLTMVGFYVNSLLEDHPGEMTFNEVYTGIVNGTILEDLEARFPGETDFSLFGPNSDQRGPLIKALLDASEGLEGRERRKIGIERCGLNLLMGFVLEAIQRLALP